MPNCGKHSIVGPFLNTESTPSSMQVRDRIIQVKDKIKTKGPVVKYYRRLGCGRLSTANGLWYRGTAGTFNGIKIFSYI